MDNLDQLKGKEQLGKIFAIAQQDAAPKTRARAYRKMFDIAPDLLGMYLDKAVADSAGVVRKEAAALLGDARAHAFAHAAHWLHGLLKDSDRQVQSAALT